MTRLVRGERKIKKSIICYPSLPVCQKPSRQTPRLKIKVDRMLGAFIVYCSIQCPFLYSVFWVFDRIDLI